MYVVLFKRIDKDVSALPLLFFMYSTASMIVSIRRIKNAMDDIARLMAHSSTQCHGSLEYSFQPSFITSMQINMTPENTILSDSYCQVSVGKSISQTTSGYRRWTVIKYLIG